MRNEPHDPLRRRTLQGAGLALLAPLLPGCGGGSSDSMPPESCSAAQVACVGREAIHKAMAQSGTVALSVALWSGGEVVWQEAFGWANKEDNIQATPQTRFNTGSVSKVMAALSALILQDRGLLTLDTPVVQILPDFSMLSDAYRRVTVRHLLTHSSGFPGTLGRNVFAFGPHTDYAANLQTALANTHLKHDPGELIVYCNDGFTLIERLVLKLTGQTFPEFVLANILQPLGMTHSGYTLAPLPEGSFAHPYANGKRLPQEFVSPYATGGLVSTPGDMLRLGRMFLGGGELEGRRIVSAAAIAEMGRDQSGLARINLSPDFRVGLGWDSTSQSGIRAVGQTAWEKNGFTAYFSNEFYVLPQSDMVLMLSGNSTTYGVGALAEQIMLQALLDRRLISALPTAVSVTAPAVATAPQIDTSVAGIYGNFNGPISVTLAGNTLTLRIWKAGGWTPLRQNLRLRSDGWWWEDTGDGSAFGFEVQQGLRYLIQRIPTGAGHYRWTLPMGQQMPVLADDLSAAWRARIGTAWQLANEAADSVTALNLDTYRFKLGVLPDLPGYLLWDNDELVRPLDDSRAGMTVKVPVNAGRDLGELVFVTANGTESLLRHGSVFRSAQE